jgi:hypothetical protein
MNSLPELSPMLRGLLISCDEIASVHGIPLEAVVLQTLAHASALAGDLVTSKPDGRAQLPAKFSVIVRTPDSDCPGWIGAEIDHLLSRQEQMLRAGDQLGGVTKLRRQKRALQAIGAEEEDAGNSDIDQRIALAKRRPSFRFIHQVNQGKLHSGWEAPHRIALAATGLSAFRKLLSRTKGDPYASLHGLDIAARPNVIGWISSRDWGRLAKETTPCQFTSFGWVVECCASNYRPEVDVAPRSVAAKVLQRLEIVRLGAIKFNFQPDESAKTLLDQHGNQVRLMLAGVPDSIRAHAMPDPSLAWSLAALLVALCGYGADEEARCSELQCTRVAGILASWVMGRHIHDYRQDFPADSVGLISGQDLRVFRFLTSTPAPVRSFQRRLRGVDKDSCLKSLHRLVAAGLAVEGARERFVAVAPPDRGSELSEFDPKRIFPLGSQRNSTDNTDKAT